MSFVESSTPVDVRLRKWSALPRAFVLCSIRIQHTQGGAGHGRHAIGGSGCAHARAALNFFLAAASRYRQQNELWLLADGEDGA